jgi:WD40 repeat protein
MTNQTSPKTILILAANPQNTTRLRLEEEIREIDEGLRRANQRHQYKLEQKLAVRSRDFYRAILDYKPSIVHFCGHGVGQEGIVLEDDTGKSAVVPTNALASMFKLFATKGVECVILNACYSEVQATAISQYVNYVLGMNKAVGDQAALAFSVAFYDGLAAGYEVEEAHELGCSQMMSFLEHETPVLKKKPLIDSEIDSEDNPDLTAFKDFIPPNPYQGLAAFGEEDADFFFGQENFVDKLVEATNQQPLVGVIGPSGSGKSSVVFAGLIPKLRQEGNWLIEIFKPGKDPFLPLAFALVRQLEPEAGETHKMREAMGLASDFQQGRITVKQVIDQILERNPGKRLLLVADQLEELFTLCPVKEEQKRFADELLATIPQENITLVFTLRADFYGYVLSYRPFRDALETYTPKLLSSMKREELQQAIELPAQKLDVQLEDQLTERILDDVGQEPGNLPLLEFALTRLWEKQKHRTLTHAAYDEIGGVKKAIANHAEQVYQKLTKTEKKQAQRIFLQLVRPGEGTEDTRRVATREEVGEENWNLVSYLAGHQARLVVTGRHQRDLTPLPPSLPLPNPLHLSPALSTSPQPSPTSPHPSPTRRGGKGRKLFIWNGEKEIVFPAVAEKEQNQSPSPRRRGVGGEVTSKEEKEQNQSPSPPRRGVWGEVTFAEDKEQNQSPSPRRGGVGGEVTFAEEKEQNQSPSPPRRGVGGEVTFAEDTVEVIHEALIREWLTLREWMNANRQFRTWQERLKLALREWKKNNHDAGNLLRGAPLTVAEDWLQKRADEMTQEERDFIQASLKDQNKQKRIRQLAVLSLAGGFLLTLGLAGIVGVSWREARISQINALAQYSDALLNLDESKAVKTSLKAVLEMQRTPWVDADTHTLVELTLLNTVSFVVAPNSLGGHTKDVLAVSYSQNSKLLAAASLDSTVKLWNPTTKQEIKTLKGHTGGVWDSSFSPDGKVLATGSFDNTVKLWNTTTGKEIKTLVSHTKEVSAVSFSPNGKYLATGSADHTVKLWDTSNWKEIKTLPGHTGQVWAVSFSPDGKMLATASLDNTVKLWDTTKWKAIKTLTDHTDWVWDVCFSPDSKLLVTASKDNTVKLWDTTKWKAIKTLTEHKNGVLAVSFSPDSKLLATASKDNTVKLWDTTKWKAIKTLTDHTEWVWDVSFSPDGKQLATGSADNTVQLWNSTTGKGIKPSMSHMNLVNTVSFSPNGKQLATGSADNTVKLWDSSTGKEIKTLTGHTKKISAVSFSPDSKLLATGSADNSVKLWDTSTWKEIQTLTRHTSPITAVSFSPDGKWLATVSADNGVKLWDTSTWKEIQTLTGHTKKISAVSFSPDSKLLATGSADNSVKLWDTSTWKEIQTLTGHINPITTVSFSLDGKQLATASYDNSVKLWDTSTWKEIQTLTGHRSEVSSVSFSPDGKRLVTGSGDKTVKLWDTSTGKELKTLTGHKKGVLAVSFSPDGKLLATGGDDNTVRLWQLDFNYLVEEGCNFINNYLKPNPDDAEAQEIERQLCRKL